VLSLNVVHYKTVSSRSRIMPCTQKKRSKEHCISLQQLLHPLRKKEPASTTPYAAVFSLLLESPNHANPTQLLETRCSTELSNGGSHHPRAAIYRCGGGGGSAGESLNENNKNPQLRTSNKHVINQKKWLSYCIS
jgi:hypothetical protein